MSCGKGIDEILINAKKLALAAIKRFKGQLKNISVQARTEKVCLNAEVISLTLSAEIGALQRFTTNLHLATNDFGAKYIDCKTALHITSQLFNYQ